MEHLCHQCGAAVEDGTPFCPSCGAPQIRIASLEEPPASAPLLPGTPGEAQPAAQPVPLPPTVSAPAGVEWSHAVPAAAMAGVLLAIAWIVPFLGFLLWLMAAGLVAVALYRRRVPGAELTSGMGARIGAICGLFGFAVFALLLGMELLATRGSGKFRAMLQQVIEQAGARNADPRAQQVLQQMMSPAGLALLVTFVMVLFLAGFLAFGSLGGAVGAWVFRRKDGR